MKRVLLLGCGNSHDKRISFPGGDWGLGSPEPEFETGTVFLHDRDPAVIDKFQIPTTNQHNLNELPYPWETEYFDEIHAYEVLEHTGRQGDGEFFFGQFNELWRITKPGGYLAISVPMWDAEVAFGVPDHVRVLPPGIFGFLSEEYYENVGKPGYGDYRHLLKGCYWTPIGKNEGDEQLNVVLWKDPKHCR